MFLSDPAISKNVGQIPLMKEKLEFVSHEATSAQAKECFGSETYPELLPCVRRRKTYQGVLSRRRLIWNLTN